MKIYRLLEILTILLRRERITTPELARRLGVSERTIRRDVDDLCLAGVPIVTRQGAGGGVSIAEGYTLDKRLLLPKELQNILAGLRGLDSVGAGGDIKPLLDKLGDLQTGGGGDVVIDLASHYRESLSEKIAALKKAVADRHVVAFDYYSDKGTTQRRVEPHFVAFKWSSWYLFGYCLLREDFRLFKLNRLWRLEACEATFTPRDVPPEKLDFDERLQDRVAVVVDFDAGVEYLLIDSFGPDCYWEMPDGRLRFERGYTEPEHMTSWILSFGAQAEVVSPPALREAVAEEARKMAALYEQDILLSGFEP